MMDEGTPRNKSAENKSNDATEQQSLAKINPARTFHYHSVPKQRARSLADVAGYVQWATSPACFSRLPWHKHLYKSNQASDHGMFTCSPQQLALSTMWQKGHSHRFRDDVTM